MHGQSDLIQEGMVTGIGRHIENQSMYEGQFLHNKRHGFGRLFWNDGTYYTGKWANDLRNGYGKLI